MSESYPTLDDAAIENIVAASLARIVRLATDQQIPFLQMETRQRPGHKR
ncbi:MAG TPA: hypothetical protein VHR15_14010 [Ktedonobacterales bacterium]|jgi:hypothetical protein|nr:hypothetical protein [Ktedonobacterales bacterium]